MSPDTDDTQGFVSYMIRVVTNIWPTKIPKHFFSSLKYFTFFTAKMSVFCVYHYEKAGIKGGSLIIMEAGFKRAKNELFKVVRPRPNVQRFMRRTKLSELSSGSVKFVWMSFDGLTRSIPLGLRRMERLKIVCGTNVHLHRWLTKVAVIKLKFVW